VLRKKRRRWKRKGDPSFFRTRLGEGACGRSVPLPNGTFHRLSSVILATLPYLSAVNLFQSGGDLNLFLWSFLFLEANSPSRARCRFFFFFFASGSLLSAAFFFSIPRVFLNFLRHYKTGPRSRGHDYSLPYMRWLQGPIRSHPIPGNGLVETCAGGVFLELLVVSNFFLPKLKV